MQYPPDTLVVLDDCEGAYDDVLSPGALKVYLVKNRIKDEYIGYTRFREKDGQNNKITAVYIPRSSKYTSNI